jgi:(S)-3,5-dihydroxyphenylglycine transaminase
MNFLNEVTTRFPKAVSFAPGRPYEEFFETTDIFDHLHRYLDHLAEEGVSPAGIRNLLYQYGPTAGFIRELIAASLRDDENIDVSPESIVVTVGCQEAMLLSLRALISGPADVLLVCSPCYVGILGAARLLDITVVGVDEDEQGRVSPARLEEAILTEKARGRRPTALYVVPDHSNPTGNTMSLEARQLLLDLAARHDFLVLEDSPYRLVSPGVQLPTLKALDRARRVVHLGSYSKTAFPGARLGFVVADQPVRDDAGRPSLLADELAKIKSMVTVNTPSLSQAVVAGMLLEVGGRMSTVNAGAAVHYGNALRTALDCLERHLPPERRDSVGVRWNEPDGGFFLTLQVPFDVDEASLTRSAEEFGVIWTPMSYFYPKPGNVRAIRLSVSYLSSEDIEKGISRLTRFIESQASTITGGFDDQSVRGRDRGVPRAGEL